MIAFELLKDEGVLVVKPDSTLTADDFEAVARAVDPFILENGKLSGLLIDTPSFPGWDSFGALIEHIKFVREHHRNIDGSVRTRADCKASVFDCAVHAEAITMWAMRLP